VAQPVVAKAVVAPVAKKAAPAKKVAPARPSATYVGDQKFLDHQRELLLGERSTYLHQSELLKAEAESLVEEMEPGDIQFDEESGEGGTLTVDRERDLVLSAQAQLAVEDIDDALRKITRGRYGVCEGCGDLISKPRLEAMPFARLCIACKSGGLSRR
jgi:DnaK suppressor protein